MKTSIFYRLLLGYLAIFLLVAAASVYAIVQLDRLNDLTRSVQRDDNRMMDLEKSMTDSFLSQVRNERKFVITKDKALLQQFLLFEGDFGRFLQQAREVGKDGVADSLLRRIQKAHASYVSLFHRERSLIEDNVDYDREAISREKEHLSETILSDLRELKIKGQQDIFAKLEKLDTLGTAAIRFTVALTLASLIAGICISFFITHSITRPIGLLETKTREIARGNLEDDLDVVSPPEIGRLAKAFNAMCSRLKEVDKMKSDFFSMMSHELRTPLTSIKEGIGLLLDEGSEHVNDRQRRILAILAEESHRLIALVNSVLDLAKMEAGMMSYHFEPANVARLIERVMIEIAPLAEAKKVELHSEVGPLPLVKLDSEGILKVLRNLVGNAVKFTKKGTVTVVARVTPEGVMVKVSDSGPGIPRENLVSIFEKFQQGGHSGPLNGGGTGLGLAIARHILSSHGGKIWAESKLSHGSTFTFLLPF